MVSKKIMDDLSDISKHLSDAVPSGLKELGGDLERTFHDILQGAFSKFDLVSREEFDVQADVLIRTREKLDALEKRVAELEKNSKA